MGLYDREYARGRAADHYAANRSETQVVSFVKETYKLFAASLMAAAVGSYVGIPIAGTLQAMHWPLFFLVIGLLIGLHFAKHKQGLNLILLFAFTFATGMMIAPLLSVVLGMSGGATIVGNAFAMTSVIFGAMSFYAIRTTKDFTSFSKPLFIALLVIIGFSIVNIFLGSPMMAVIISAAAVFLFSIFVVYDTQAIMRGMFETPIEGAVALYLDFFNIFVNLLQLLGIFGGSED
ncbi:Bax inhibitor-1/YccA family protein [Sulfurimonas sp. HSL-3221]|uniref:Bax inhibitor-1/YccA family protein n=1 Tax=Sulfurimonadaceae TaxID=2771471 RepID=UPI001E598670|nr:Bax inhibitor-1/YccA family protein [Sulfurimonas sp. HSL-3221]UFS62469.1 Bax inhibitor-1/YccA family protein [Sulfurimonas sp. HSL-3221]